LLVGTDGNRRRHRFSLGALLRVRHALSLPAHAASKGRERQLTGLPQWHWDRSGAPTGRPVEAPGRGFGRRVERRGGHEPLPAGHTAAMGFEHPPATACWQHRGLRSGFEVTYFAPRPHRVRIEGTTAGLQDGDTWIVTYAIDLDNSWCTRAARITTRTSLDVHTCRLTCDGAGRWEVNGNPAAHLDGCYDVDLESSAMTNALPVHRLGLAVGESMAVPAAYVRVRSGGVERLDQRYERGEDRDGHQQYAYAAPAFDFRCQLVYDESGLVLDYPGIAARAG
jgi:uncharacterized protein